MNAPRHFLDLRKLDRATLRDVLDRAVAYKNGKKAPSLKGKTLALVFEKPSTRTRISFQVGMRALGGETLSLTQDDSQLGRGETIADTARVLSRYVDAIMFRTSKEKNLLEMAEHASVPVINGLTDTSHPCQLMADVMTFEEHRGPIAGRTVAWCGDGNNVAATWIQASLQFDFALHLACPASRLPAKALLDWANQEGERVTLFEDPQAALVDADCVVTDTWFSMGHSDGEAVRKLLAPYQVNDILMKAAKAEAIFMHCLPAHRGEEVTPSVLDGPQSVVWDEAENRLHAQKGILTWCLA
ncbi:MAG: ornithine carbamoyltransferase [Alphaproteobacteria bacterium]|nr:ornithine carbamoyltransferase [Alphaproteobacteria bacterium]